MPARRPSRARRSLGQTLIVVVLVLPVLFGFAALAVGVGFNLADRRSVQTSADVGALAGANALANGTVTTLQTGQQYAWRDLGQTVPSLASCTASPCTVSSSTWPQAGSYQVTVTTPYTANDSLYNAFSSEAVAVDITHQEPQIAFAAMIGFSSVTIKSHAAAIAQAGLRTFPFALATRFLDIQGSSAVGAYGAALIGQCDDSGKGDFTDKGNNGGIYFNGGTSFVLGSAKSSSTATDYTSAQALVISDPTHQSCSPPKDASSGWSGFLDHVSFDANATQNPYNYWYGFDSGPSGCSTAAAAMSTCTKYSGGNSPTNNSGWMDPCYVLGGSGAVNLTTATFAPGSGISSGTTYSCGALPGDSDSHAGSFLDALWPGLPLYAPPAILAAGLGAPPATSGSAALGTSNSAGSNYGLYFKSGSISGSSNLTFTPGWYVFDNVSLDLGQNSSITCSAYTSGPLHGCVFIFKNGAHLTASQSKTAINCDGDDNPSTQSNCSFEFDAKTTTDTSYLQFSQGLAVHIHPIAYTPAGSSGTSLSFPVIYTLNAANCMNDNLHCAISLSQSGTLDLSGTIYAPNGIVNINANAQPVSGQVIADTLELQGGAASAGAGVGYNGSSVAPTASPPELIE